MSKNKLVYSANYADPLNASNGAVMNGLPDSTGRPRTKEIIDPNYLLLQARATSIKSIRQETFQYGPTDVHKLDVYYPPSLRIDKDTNDLSIRVLVFFYGGGLSRGARSSPPSYLVYNNLGAFFASRGILTVIPDYRLVPSAVFPQGSEDVRDALDWVTKNILSKYNKGNNDHNNPLFVLAHSAGGLHVSGFLLTPSMFSASLATRRVLRGVAFIGVPYEFHRSKPAFRNATTQYYGDAKNAYVNQPLGLLRRVERDYVATLLPPVKNILAESEPRSVSSSSSAFVQVFKDKGGNITEHKLVGHDHMSPILALGSGSGEAWGEDLVEWMNSFPLCDECAS